MYELDKRISSVTAELDVAFRGLSPPASDDIIAPGNGSYGSFRDRLAGKTWDEMTPGFYSTWASGFGSLTPTAFRYYIRGLLQSALDDLDGKYSPLWNVLIALGPNWYGYYTTGSDCWNVELVSLLTPEQYQAVQSFLGLILETRDSFRAAQALRWRWNRYEHPALDASRRFYDRLHHYEYPPAEDSEIDCVVTKIRAWFDARPYPGDDRIVSPPRDDEPAEYALEFRGLDWRTIHPEFLAVYADGLSFFTREAFCYFLPAFMIAGIMTDYAPDLEFHLTNGLAPKTEAALCFGADKLGTKLDWNALTRKQFSVLTRSERAAVICYFRHAMGSDIAYEAFDTYWRPSLKRGWTADA